MAVMRRAKVCWRAKGGSPTRMERTFSWEIFFIEPLVPLVPTLAALQALPGIGEWTAQYVAMRALGWPNAFPLGDYVLRKRLADGDGTLPTRRAMVERAEPWAPWRAYAAMHLWHREDALAQPASH